MEVELSVAGAQPSPRGLEVSKDGSVGEILKGQESSTDFNCRSVPHSHLVLEGDI